MKKQISLLFLISISLFAFPANAGTIYAGAQAWYSMWDSGMARLQADIAESAIRLKLDEYETQINNLLPPLATIGDTEVEIKDPETKGYLAGPVAGYITSDKLWRFELSAMLFGAYTSNVDTTLNINYTFPFLLGTQPGYYPVEIATELEIEQREINFEARRNIGKNFGLLAGYKYMSFKTELDMDYDFTIAGTTLFTTENSIMFKSDMHMLYVGAYGNYSIIDKLNLKAGAAFGVPFAGSSENELIIDGTDYSTDYNIEMAYLIMGNIALNYTLADAVSIDLGYQLRMLTLKVADVDIDLDGNAEDSSDYSDLFHGVYFNAVYMFDI